MPVARLVRDVADRAQEHTQRSWKRPYGVGLLVAGLDKTGARLHALALPWMHEVLRGTVPGCTGDQHKSTFHCRALPAFQRALALPWLHRGRQHPAPSCIRANRPAYYPVALPCWLSAEEGYQSELEGDGSKECHEHCMARGASRCTVLVWAAASVGGDVF